MNVTVVVPTIRARPDLLDACTASIHRTLRDGDQLIVVVGGTFAENVNRGAMGVETDLMVTVNDDCKVDQDDWLEKLTKPFDDPQVAVVGCRLIYPNGKLQHAGVYLQLDDGILNGHHHLEEQPSGPVDAVTAACMAVRTDLFRKMGGFDEAFRNGNEDVDFCLRVRGDGLTVWYESSVTLIHHESASGPARWTHVADNIRLFNERWTATPL